MKTIFTALLFTATCFGQFTTFVNMLPPGLVYLSKDPTSGAVTIEGISLGSGLVLKTDPSGKRSLEVLQVPVLGTRMDWNVPLTCSSATVCTSPNEPFGQRAIVVQIQPNGTLVLMGAGFTIVGRTFTFTTPVPAGNTLVACYFF